MDSRLAAHVNVRWYQYDVITIRLAGQTLFLIKRAPQCIMLLTNLSESGRLTILYVWRPLSSKELSVLISTKTSHSNVKTITEKCGQTTNLCDACSHDN